MKRHPLIWPLLKKASLGLALVVSTAAARDVQGATITMTGSRDWSSVTIWTRGTVSGAYDAAVIQPLNE